MSVEMDAWIELTYKVRNNNFGDNTLFSENWFVSTKIPQFN